jgi:hypothetical protein
MDASKPVLTEPDDLFATVKLDDAGAMRCAIIRSGFTMLLATVRDAIPPSRYRSLCETALETACMWAIKGVTRMH